MSKVKCTIWDRKKLREARRILGLSPAEMAGEIGCHPAYIGMLESGAKRPSEDTIVAYSKAIFDKPIYWFLKKEQGSL